VGMWATRSVVQAPMGNCFAVTHGRGISTALAKLLSVDNYRYFYRYYRGS
jgi:hypothetical protein